MDRDLMLGMALAAAFLYIAVSLLIQVRRYNRGQ